MEAVASLLNEHFVMVKVHRTTDEAQALGYLWTPTVIFYSADGIERMRSVGYLPEATMVNRIRLGLGAVHLGEKRNDEAAMWFRLAAEGGVGDQRAEGRYWLGVARFRAGGGDKVAWQEEWGRLREEHPDSEWTQKASPLWVPAREKPKVRL